MSSLESVAGLFAKTLNSPGAKDIVAVVLVTVIVALSSNKLYQVPVCWKNGEILWVVTPKFPIITTFWMSAADEFVKWILFNPLALPTSKVKSEVSKISYFSFNLISFISTYFPLISVPKQVWTMSGKQIRCIYVCVTYFPLIFHLFLAYV